MIKSQDIKTIKTESGSIIVKYKGALIGQFPAKMPLKSLAIHLKRQAA